MMFLCKQASGVIPAGTIVSALLISDLSSLPVPEEVPITRTPT